MKIIMVVVSTINGKLTSGGDPNIYKWTSKEDSKMFFSLIKKHNLIVMGSRTYEASRKIIKHKKGKLRIVLTRNPEKYKSEVIDGQLGFSNESPKELVERLEKQGYTKMLLVGGSEINTIFLENNLVDELYLTIEPLIFGKGKNLVIENELNVSLRLVLVKKLNKKGTLWLRYKVS